ncbi:hypothetical protein [Bordetella tumulicola]|uniref:hypothetical protein n=1 Tax=Bordetella tumulicola TaxID=1649133 RepID=UPI0039F0012F
MSPNFQRIVNAFRSGLTGSHEPSEPVAVSDDLLNDLGILIVKHASLTADDLRAAMDRAIDVYGIY